MNAAPACQEAGRRFAKIRGFFLKRPAFRPIILNNARQGGRGGGRQGRRFREETPMSTLSAGLGWAGSLRSSAYRDQLAGENRSGSETASDSSGGGSSGRSADTAEETDSVQFSSRNVVVSSAINLLFSASGTYSLSAQSQSYASQLAAYGLTGSDDLSGLSGDASTYWKILLLASLVGQNDPSGAARFLQTIRSLSAALGASSNQTAASGASAASAAVSSLSATVNVSATVSDGTSTTMASVSVTYSIVNGKLVEEQQAAQADPLVLDLSGDGLSLRRASDGVEFDLTGSGTEVTAAFVQGDDALLYLDTNGNGVADDGNELFGDQEGYADGFAELAAYDDNGDGVIDAADAVYSDLRLWQDWNGDGVNQAGESLTLAQAGVSAISLGSVASSADDGQGNTVAQIGSFTRADGTTGLAADVLLAYYA